MSPSLTRLTLKNINSSNSTGLAQESSLLIIKLKDFAPFFKKISVAWNSKNTMSEPHFHADSSSRHTCQLCPSVSTPAHTLIQSIHYKQSICLRRFHVNWIFSEILPKRFPFLQSGTLNEERERITLEKLLSYRPCCYWQKNWDQRAKFTQDLTDKSLVNLCLANLKDPIIINMTTEFPCFLISQLPFSRRNSNIF